MHIGNFSSKLYKMQELMGSSCGVVTRLHGTIAKDGGRRQENLCKVCIPVSRRLLALLVLLSHFGRGKALAFEASSFPKFRRVRRGK